MRKITIFVFLLATLTCAAENQLGKFMLNTSVEKLPVDDALEYVNSHFEFPEKTTFEMFRDETDDIGMRHCSYQQFVDGVEVANAMILVHSKNGIISTINGDILSLALSPAKPQKILRPQEAANRVRHKASATNAKLKIVRVCDKYRYAYAVMSEDNKSLKYVDAECGEIIKTVPLVYNADVAGTAQTMYSGKQNIVCYELDGLYTLYDEGRNILTLNAADAYNIDYDKIYDAQDEQAALNALSDELEKYIDACDFYWSSSPNWSSTWNYQLKAVGIAAINKGAWYEQLVDEKPDVYIKIKNSSGTVIYKSEYIDDLSSFPCTFNISNTINLTDPPYFIEVWDYDPIGSDDIIDTYTITTITTPIQFFSGNISLIGVSIENNGYQPALDVHWGMEKTYDFYKNILNRNSYDNKGTRIYQMVNPNHDDDVFYSLPLNAFAIKKSPYPMAYGMGLISLDVLESMLPVVSIDIIAHEFTHLVTALNGNGGLEYLGEAGALDESFSDIMGISVKNYVKGKNNWLIGDEVMVYYSNLRSMKDPNSSKDGDAPQPDTYRGLFWANTQDEESDNGGVHTNSGVQNFWYYLLCEGGTGTNDKGKNYNVTGIGIDKGIQIAYRNLIYYITPEATHAEARAGAIQAAIDLYGKDSQEEKAVTNAWYAVGVGDAYVEPFSLTPGKYVIVANRGKTDDGNWYYMTSNLGTASNKRFQAVTTGTSDINNVAAKDLESKYVWMLEADGDNWKLKNGNNYVTWTSGNTANLAAEGKPLVCNADGSLVNVHFNDGTAERYLSLNSTTGNDYFAFYTSTGTIRGLGFIPYEESVTPPPTPSDDRFVVVAQRNTSSNWYYMTSDLGTASNKRYQAVDSKTSNIASVNTTELDDKFYWSIEGNKLKTGTQYSTWTSGNTASLDNTGIELNIEQNADGTYKFSFVDSDSKTRYLSFNKTAGNDYFAYYYSQLSDLTLIKEGTPTIPTALSGAELPFSLRQYGHTLIFTAQQPTDVSIFSPTGMVVVKADGITANTFRLAQGIYILRANYVTQKIIIK